MCLHFKKKNAWGLAAQSKAVSEACKDSKGCEFGPQAKKLFTCSSQLSMKFSLLMNIKMPTTVGIVIFYFLAEIFSCSTMFRKKEFAIVSNLRFISRTKFMLS